MLVVNFSYNSFDFDQVIERFSIAELETVRVFDFAATISKDKRFSVSYPSDIDRDNHFHKLALKNYIEETGELSKIRSTISNHSIREIEVDGFSLFWLTDISEKHPQNCVLKNLYYYKYLFDLIDGKNERIMIVLPTKGLHFQSAILQFIQEKGARAGEVSFNGTFNFNTSYYTYIHYLKNFFAKVKGVKKNIPKSFEKAKPFDHLIFTYFPQTWRGSAEGDYVLGGIHKWCEEYKVGYKYLPLIFDYKDFETLKPEGKFDQNYWTAFPSYFQVMKLFRQLLLSYKRVTRANYNLEKISFVDKKAIDYEFLNVLHNKLEFFINYKWLRNYFNGTNFGFNAYYQDEFYRPGRLISRAAKLAQNKNITTVGVQHGIFYEAHTVYSIADAEINASDAKPGMPIPDFFITWGKYFKELFLSNNSLKNNYVMSAGNPNYINRVLAVSGSGRHTKKSVKTKFLWCTSLKVDVINSYKNILKDFVADNDVEMQIRCHPQIDLKNFITDELIDESSIHKYTFSSHSTILEAIDECDVVLSVSGSTVFLDALVAGKPVFHLVNNDYFMGSLGKNEMKHIENSADMYAAYEEFKSNKENLTDPSYLLTLDKTEWINILEKTKK